MATHKPHLEAQVWDHIHWAYQLHEDWIAEWIDGQRDSHWYWKFEWYGENPKRVAEKLVDDYFRCIEEMEL